MLNLTWGFDIFEKLALETEFELEKQPLHTLSLRVGIWSKACLFYICSSDLHFDAVVIGFN